MAELRLIERKDCAPGNSIGHAEWIPDFDVRWRWFFYQLATGLFVVKFRIDHTTADLVIRPNAERSEMFFRNQMTVKDTYIIDVPLELPQFKDIIARAFPQVTPIWTC